MALPDFLIVGAMKCGTSTLHAQLAAQSGIFMSSPKEPNFFSDDDVYARGAGWYQQLFANAPSGALKGEASTHYSKLPTYPHTIERMSGALRKPKLIYLMRNPVERAVSHFIHDWTLGDMPGDLNRAMGRHPELIDYGRYAMQLAPYVQAFGREAVLLVSLERMQRQPQAELARVAAHIGLKVPVVWQADRARANASAERIRRFPFYDLLVENPVAGSLRRALVPQGIRKLVKSRLQLSERPVLADSLIRDLEARFADDHALLCRLFPDGQVPPESFPFLHRYADVR